MLQQRGAPRSHSAVAAWIPLTDETPQSTTSVTRATACAPGVNWAQEVIASVVQRDVPISPDVPTSLTLDDPSVVALLRHGLEHVPDLFCIADFNGYPRWQSAFWESALGWTLAELKAQPLLTFVHPDDRERTLAQLAHLSQGHPTITFENRYAHKGGGYRWLQWNAVVGDGQLVFAAARDITQTKAAELLARERQRMLDLAEDVAEVGHWRLPVGAPAPKWSPKVFEIHGQTGGQEPDLEAAVNAYHPEDRAKVADYVRRAFEQKEPFRFHLRLLRPDGELRHVESAARPELDETGAVVAVVGAFRDITSRFREQQELKKLALVARSTGNPVIIADREGRIEWVNGAFTRMTGYTEQEAVGLKPSSLLQGPATDRETVGRMRAALSRQEGFEEEILNYHKDGTPYWVGIEVKPIISDDGQVKFIAIQSDLTERKRAEGRLKASEELLNETGRIARVGGWQYDVETNAITWTDEVFHIHELPIGAPPSDVGEVLAYYAEEERPRLQQAIQQCLLTGEPYDLELRFRTARGRSLWVRAFGTAVRESGRTVRLRGAIQDITQAKATEAELIRAREAALEASRVKSRFLANMSHEIRTPMNGILGMAELLAQTNLTNEQKEFARIIESSGKLLLQVISDVLDLSKIESGKLELERIPCNLARIAQEAIRSIAHRIEQKGLALIVAIDPHLPALVEADPTRFQQIILNLLGNAVKFSEVGEIEVSLAYRDDSFELSVRDTGTGIPIERQAHLFNAFTQADQSTTRKFGGTGLGLAICRELADGMGGTIGVQSVIGEGSTFTARLPLPILEPQPIVQFVKDGTRRRVLLVAPGARQRAVLRQQLDAAGVEVGAEAKDAMEAIAAIGKARGDNQPITHCVIDIKLQGLDGIALGGSLQRDPTTAGVGVVLLTGSSGAVPEEARGLGEVIQRVDVATSLVQALVGSTRRSQSVAPAPKPGGQPTAELRVLLAEDNPVNQHFASRLLELRGHHVTIVGDGREAVRTWKDGAFDVVLMDVQMPQMDGFAAAQEIRRLEHGRLERTPIIALTANAMKGDDRLCLEAGMDAYLSKPIDGAALIALMNAIVSGRPGAGGLA